MRYRRSNINLDQYRPPKKFGLGNFFSRNNKRAEPLSYESPYKNPYRKDFKKNYRRIVKLSILPATIIAWFVLMLYLPYFKITNVNFTGLKILKKADLLQDVEPLISARYKIYPGNNYFLVNTSKIADKLSADFSFNSVKVKKIFPNTLTVDVEEKISSIIYDNGIKYFLLDQNGTAIKYLTDVDATEYYQVTMGTSSERAEAFASSSVPTSTTAHVPDIDKIHKTFGDYPIIYYINGSSTTKEKDVNILPEAVIRSALDVVKLLEEGRTAKLAYFEVEEPAAGLEAYTDKPWRIFFQPFNDIPAQISNMKIILKQNKPKEYIDLRYGERVVWK